MLLSKSILKKLHRFCFAHSDFSLCVSPAYAADNSGAGVFGVTDASVRHGLVGCLDGVNRFEIDNGNTVSIHA
ncbi:MAG: hypothetical protein ACXWFG_11215 [Methylobacter sp.]